MCATWRSHPELASAPTRSVQRMMCLGSASCMMRATTGSGISLSGCSGPISRQIRSAATLRRGSARGSAARTSKHPDHSRHRHRRRGGLCRLRADRRRNAARAPRPWGPADGDSRVLRRARRSGIGRRPREWCRSPRPEAGEYSGGVRWEREDHRIRAGGRDPARVGGRPRCAAGHAALHVAGAVTRCGR